MLPHRVNAAIELAKDRGFLQSCDREVGRLLAVMAAAVPPSGRVLEIGTGAGVGTAWLIQGLGARRDVEVVTVDIDLDVSAAAARLSWPPFVRFETGDALALVPVLGRFNLVFADAVAGKWHGLETTIEALAPGGVLVVDDMAPPRWADDDHEQRTREVRASLLSDRRFAAVEISWASGVILASRLVTKVG